MNHGGETRDSGEETASLPEGWSWSGIPGADIPLPPGWAAGFEDGRDPVAVLYAPAEGDDGLRPTLVVRRGAADGASLAAISVHGMTQLTEYWNDSTVISDDAMMLGSYEARAQRFLVEAVERTAVLERWFVRTGTSVVELTGTVPVSRFLEIGPLVEQMIMGARYGAAAPMAPGLEGGYPEPVFDEQMSEATRMRLESLDAIRAGQNYLMSGPTLTRAALGLLQRTVADGAADSAAAAAAPTEYELLERQGLVADGAPSEDAEKYMYPMLHPEAQLRVTLGHRGRESRLEVWLGQDGVAALAAGAPLHHLVEFGDADHRRLEDVVVLDLVTNEAVCHVVARWMGLGPAWPVSSTRLRMTGVELDARVSDGPGESADPTSSLAARLGDAEWVAVTVEQVPEGAGPNITLVHALGAGYYQPAPPNGDFAAIKADTELGFTALPPRQVLDLLIGIVDHLISDD